MEVNIDLTSLLTIHQQYTTLFMLLYTSSVSFVRRRAQ